MLWVRWVCVEPSRPFYNHLIATKVIGLLTPFVSCMETVNEFSDVEWFAVQQKAALIGSPDAIYFTELIMKFPWTLIPTPVSLLPLVDPLTGG